MKIIVPGSVALHTWRGLTLNDMAAWPRYNVEHVDGLRSLADPEARQDPATGRDGEIARKAARRGKTITYRGTIEGIHPWELWSLRDDLLEAFNEINEVSRMDMVPHASVSGVLPPDLEAPAVFFHARALTGDVSDEVEQVASGWGVRFAIALRMLDARIYDSAEAGPFDTSALAVQTGISLPVSAPFTIPAPGGSAGQVAVVNEGRTAVDPVITLHGPGRNPAVHNDTLGMSLLTKDLELPAGGTLVVDFKERVARLEGQTDASHKIDLASSDWWDEGVPGLGTGITIVRFTAENAADPARASVIFNPAIV